MPAASRRKTPTQSAVVGQRHALRTLAELGERIASARRRRGWTQRELAARVGIDQTRQSQIELGRGGGAPADLWFALAAALGVPFRMEFGRDPRHELEDAGHLEMQEFLLGLARQSGFDRTFELSTKPSSPAYSVDVGLRDDRRRVLVLEECWNTFGNLGASVRSTRRKLAELAELAVVLGGEAGPYRVCGCWVVRDSERNREVLARYPEIFESTFSGSSSELVRALTAADVNPPNELGLVWCEPRKGRMTPWQRGR